jgi:demethoxyubiquinone hydroxylase (CLK1/Coq7/Cat5 family)
MIREIGKIFASGHVTSMLISRQITFDQFEEHINQQIEDLKQKESEAKQKLDQIAKIKKSIEYKTR